jgi:putative ABC transport system permease protein
VALQLAMDGQTVRMFKNYLKTALRNLLREKGTTFINVAGLTLGITCSLVLFLMVKHLSSYDSHHANRDRIYRVVTESDGNNGRFYTSGVPPVLPDAFKDDFPQAEEVTFISYRAGSLITIPQNNGQPKKFNEERGVAFGQPNFFKIFDRKIITGSAEKGLDEPGEAIISQALAKKYFGESEAIGQVVKYDTVEYKITAVMDDYPTTTDFPFDLMLSYSTIKKEKDASGWGGIWSDEQCYILLRENESASNILQAMPAFVEKYLGKNNYEHQTFNLQPLSEMHFDDRYSTFSYSTAPKEMLVTLGVIAAFLIITACINFINLSTAEAIKRSKEVGVRKSLGSTRGQLVAQFLGETTMVTSISMLISLGLAQLVLTLINGFLDVQLSMNFATDGLLWLFIIGVTVLVSLLSGLYPSFVVSGYRPALALKNQISNRSSAGYNLRRGLVVFQFFISQLFIIGTIVLINQMNYFSKQELGFRKDAILTVPVPVGEIPLVGEGSSKMRTLREEVSNIAGIESASLANTPPSSGSVSGTNFRMEGWAESDGKDTQVKQVDGNYIDLFDLKIIAGAKLEDNDTARGFVVNEQLVKVAGFNEPAEIIGKNLRMWGKTLPVIGVVKNFHTVSLRQPIEATVLLNRVRGYQTLSLKVNPAQLQSAIEQVKTKWEAAYPEHIFEYQFLDEQIREFYEGEQKMSVLLTVFSSMAIFIGCLGLFGLATFMANQRTKEIGVRKVMGASVESIILLFTLEYVKLIVIGFAIAAPVAWFLMNQWLKDFAYKITIGPAIFIFGLGITLIIAMLTVGYRSLRAAIINPVNALRYE